MKKKSQCLDYHDEFIRYVPKQGSVMFLKINKKISKTLDKLV